MKKINQGWAIVCLLSLVGCTYENYEGDCAEDSEYQRGGNSAGHGSSDGAAIPDGSSKGGGSATDVEEPSEGGGGTGTPPAPPVSCARERDCAPGYNCDAQAGQCTPAEQETCGELESERACTNRTDCVPVYGGTNCSCGQDCECKGGEPGCVCESFQFFVCQAAD